MYYNIIDVRDLVKAHRLAAESPVDHRETHGGPRYIMHGTGGRSAVRFGTELARIIHEHFPSYTLGEPATVTSQGDPIVVQSRTRQRLQEGERRARRYDTARRRHHPRGGGNVGGTGDN